ncbi:DUF892 family protein [Flavihumibacter sp. R14]|nr:DUF892 family protein [Flavihumibacter soli]
MEHIHTLEQLMAWYLPGIQETEKIILNSLENEVYPESSTGLQKVLYETDMLCRRHIEELKQMIHEFSSVLIPQRSSFGINGLTLDFNELMGRIEDRDTANAAIIVFLQTVCHYKITGYGTLSSYARILGKEHIAARLHHMLVEEKDLDHALNKIAEKHVNLHAISPQVPPHRDE